MLSKWSFQSTAVTQERCSKPSVSFRYVHTGTRSARSITISTRRSRTIFASFSFAPKATFSCARTSFSAPGTDRPVIDGEDATTALIGEVLQRCRVVGPEQTRREERAEREQQGNDGKNHNGHVAFQHHVHRVENWSGY